MTRVPPNRPHVFTEYPAEWLRGSLWKLLRASLSKGQGAHNNNIRRIRLLEPEGTSFPMHFGFRRGLVA